MAHIQSVASARKTKHGHRPSCTVCGEAIEVGQAYCWFQASRFSSKLQWHATCKQPRPSRLEPNDKKATMMAAFEDAFDQLDKLESTADDVVDEVKSIFGQVAETAREVGGMYNESADNMESGFQHETEQSQAFRSLGEEYEGWADEVERAAEDISIDEWDEDAVWSDLAGGVDVTDEVKEEHFLDFEQRSAEWAQEYIDAARDALGDVEGSEPSS